ncbi:unnamed protein product, partial [Ectocarpus sp. 4 AP-2014]
LRVFQHFHLCAIPSRPAKKIKATGNTVIRAFVVREGITSADFNYRKRRRDGAPVLALFCSVCLHNQRGTTAEKGSSFGTISARAFLRGIGWCSHPPTCGEIRYRKTANTGVPSLRVLRHVCMEVQVMPPEWAYQQCHLGVTRDETINAGSRPGCQLSVDCDVPQARTAHTAVGCLSEPSEPQ